MEEAATLQGLSRALCNCNIRNILERLKKLHKMKKTDIAHKVQTFGVINCLLPADGPKFYGTFNVKANIVKNFGNSFDETQRIMNDFKVNGCINYFSINPTVLRQTSITDVGKYLLQEQFLEAAEVLIQPRPVDACGDEVLKELIFIAQDARLLTSIVRDPPPNIIGTLFKGMMANPDGKLTESVAESAFRSFESDVKQFIDQFLQSVWNETVNLLIERRGLKLLPGDLVSVNNNVKVLTTDNIDKYSVHDMVIPVYGDEVKWPENDIATYIDEVLRKHGVEGRVWLKENIPKSLPVKITGHYRKLLFVPTELIWEIRDVTETTSYPPQKELILEMPETANLFATFYELFKKPPFEEPVPSPHDEAYKRFTKVLMQLEVNLSEKLRGKPWEIKKFIADTPSIRNKRRRSPPFDVSAEFNGSVQPPAKRTNFGYDFDRSCSSERNGFRTSSPYSRDSSLSFQNFERELTPRRIPDFDDRRENFIQHGFNSSQQNLSWNNNCCDSERYVRYDSIDRRNFSTPFQDFNNSSRTSYRSSQSRFNSSQQNESWNDHYDSNHNNSYDRRQR